MATADEAYGNPASDVPFFFKQWGGRSLKSLGRDLDGQIWNQMPVSTKFASTSRRRAVRNRLSVFGHDYCLDAYGCVCLNVL
jgi:hypothetical protein